MHLESVLEKAGSSLRQRVLALCSPATMETLEICLHTDQLSALMQSLHELQTNQLVGGMDAFADLDDDCLS